MLSHLCLTFPSGSLGALSIVPRCWDEPLMNAQRRISCFMGIASMFATASFAQQVKTDYDRNADFSKDKTYSWENVHTENPLWVDRIKAAANSALAAKGWTQVWRR